MKLADVASLRCVDYVGQASVVNLSDICPGGGYVVRLGADVQGKVGDVYEEAGGRALPSACDET